MKLRPRDLSLLAIALVITALVIIFMIFPVGTVVYEAFVFGGAFSLRHFSDALAIPMVQESIFRSLQLSVFTVILASLIGVPLAYLTARTDLPGRKTIHWLAILPLIIPGFLLALGFIFSFGESGTVNIALMKWFGLDSPVNFLYGIHGVAFIQSMHLFPIIYLSTHAAFESVDPSLAESAKDVGSKGFHLFRTVTFPLALPGFTMGALLVFIRTLGALGVPMILGDWNFIAPQILLWIRVGGSYVGIGLAIGFVLLIMATTVLVIQKWYIGRKKYTIRPSGIPSSKLVRHIGGIKRIIALFFCVAVFGLALAPHITTILAAFSRTWGISILPTGFTFANFEHAFIRAPRYLINTLFYCGLALICCIIMGFLLGYAVVRGRFAGKGIMDMLAMVAFAVPGSIVALGFMRAFEKFTIPLLGVPLTWTWMILPLALTFRRLPFMLRSTVSTIQTIDPSVEESSMDLGASRLTTVKKIVFPLALKGITAGAIMTFIYLMIEVPVIMFLTPTTAEGTMTYAILDYTDIGELHYAAAFGVIMLVITLTLLFIITKILKVSAAAVTRGRVT